MTLPRNVQSASVDSARLIELPVEFCEEDIYALFVLNTAVHLSQKHRIRKPQFATISVVSVVDIVLRV